MVLDARRSESVSQDVHVRTGEGTGLPLDQQGCHTWQPVANFPEPSLPSWSLPFAFSELPCFASLRVSHFSFHGSYSYSLYKISERRVTQAKAKQ